jgi:pimeloyl-ACP methyl ester carboxylesterase
LVCASRASFIQTRLLICGPDIKTEREKKMAEGVNRNLTRRGVLTSAAATGLGTMAAISGAPTIAHAADQKTFVLVHGASAGGWCYRQAADLLEKRGHKVFAPTLTGLGERSHLMSGSINLDTHIADVVNVIKWEGLENIVLVGHSYGGWVISGVAEQTLPAISSIVYLDAFMPEDGQKGLDMNSERSRAEIAEALKRGEVSRPAPPPTVWNVAEKNHAWWNAKATAQPIGVALQPIKLTGARERVAKKTYIRATGYENPNFEAAYQKRKADPSWRTYTVPCGHEVMMDMPERLVEILQEVA